MTDIEALKNEATGIVQTLANDDKIHAIKRLRIIHSKLIHCMVKAAHEFSDTASEEVKVKPSLAFSYADYVWGLIKQAQQEVNPSQPGKVKAILKDGREISLKDMETINPFMESPVHLDNLFTPTETVGVWSTLIGGTTNYNRDDSGNTSAFIDNLKSEEITKFLQGKQESSKENHGITVVKFWADWCGPSNRFRPEWIKFAEKAKAEGINVYHVNVGHNPDKMALSKEWGVTAYPTVIVLTPDKKIILSGVSNKTGDELFELVKQHST